MSNAAANSKSGFDANSREVGLLDVLKRYELNEENKIEVEVMPVRMTRVQMDKAVEVIKAPHKHAFEGFEN